MVFRIPTSLLFILGLTLFAGSAVSAPLDKAIEAWLADDDKTALPALAAQAGSGRGYNQPWRLGPPSNTLISEERYLASLRIHADMSRHIATLMKRWTQYQQTDWSTKSRAAASRFRTRFP